MMATLRPWAERMIARRLGLIVMAAWLVLCPFAILIWAYVQVRDDILPDVASEWRQLRARVFPPTGDCP